MAKPQVKQAKQAKATEESGYVKTSIPGVVRIGNKYLKDPNYPPPQVQPEAPKRQPYKPIMDKVTDTSPRPQLGLVPGYNPFTRQNTPGDVEGFDHVQGYAKGGLVGGDYQADYDAANQQFLKNGPLTNWHPIDDIQHVGDKAFRALGKNANARADAISQGLQKPSTTLEAIGNTGTAPVTMAKGIPDALGNVLGKKAYAKNYQKGGEVKGPGTATSDSIPAKLSKGEVVIPANVVKHFGLGTFKKMIAAVPPQLGAKTTVKKGVVNAAAGVTDKLVKDPFLNGQPAPVDKYLNEYKGMPVVPAIGKAMTDYGGALAQGAKGVAKGVAGVLGPQEGFKNLLYGEGNPSGLDNMFGNSGQPAAPAATKPAVPATTTTPASAGFPAAKPFTAQQSPYEGALALARPEAAGQTAPEATGQEAGLGPTASINQSMKPYQLAGGRSNGKLNPQQGASVNTMDFTTSPTEVNPKGGLGSVQWKDNRKLSNESQDYLGGVLAREADPGFQQRLKEQAKIVDDRYAWARNREAERQQEAQQANLNAQIQQAQAVLMSPDFGGKKAAAQFLEYAGGLQRQQSANQQDANQFGQTMAWNKEQAKALGATEANKLKQQKEIEQAKLDANKFATRGGGIDPNTGQVAPGIVYSTKTGLDVGKNQPQDEDIPDEEYQAPAVKLAAKQAYEYAKANPNEQLPARIKALVAAYLKNQNK